MPKIVNRVKYIEELATKAAGYFSQHGYAGVGMRGIAEHLGVSKSALYHYFPTKEALFLACTQSVMGRVGETISSTGKSENEQLSALYTSMKDEFGSEMILVLEYLRGKNSQEIAEDAAMQVALSAFLETIERIVGADRAVHTLENIIGKLMLDYLSGGAIAQITGAPNTQT
ncbi:TetR/AcrR family transcriptional regulator [Ahrensia sp. 13_GOM-1096m]|uniref:TetR/AcrR family transcriptional regulator n=1 Tax=Ahrensia sp. 13_GOM-1096m TaxID=1380380 RepID=UPI0004797942|nr:TetR/AcrR family transcriptional regulator [Ahrensia sp. 13_GOM-1096m]